MQGLPAESAPIGVARHKTSPESLRAMVEFEGFFTPCPNCWTFRSSRDALLNYWDCDSGTAHCSACVLGLPGQTLVQVREGRGLGFWGRAWPFCGPEEGTGH